MHPFQAQRALFKAYDIRGNISLFTPEFLHALGNTFAQHLINEIKATKVVIGYDVRHLSQSIAKYIALHCHNCGIQVIWLGLITTPMMAFWANSYEGHGFIATASHSQSNISGLKWLINRESPDEGFIKSIYQQLSVFKPTESLTINLKTNDEKIKTISGNNNQSTLKFNGATANQPINLTPNVVANTYFEATFNIIKSIQLSRRTQLFSSDSTINNHYNNNDTNINSSNNNDTSSLNIDNSDNEIANSTSNHKVYKIVIDCLNGATGLFAKQFFKQHSSLCSEVIVLNDMPNGDFPKGNPDPMENNRLNELSDAVIRHQADMGLAFDGDGDRLMVIDDQGKPLAPDYLLYLLSRVAVEDSRFIDKNNQHSSNSTPIVIFDVKCSHHLPKLIKDMGASPLMSRTGSSVLRRALQSKEHSCKCQSFENKPSTNNLNITNQLDKKAIFAGELSGHFIFNDGHFIVHDDAMYAALRLISWLQHQANIGMPYRLTDIIDALPAMIYTPDVYLSLKNFEKIKSKESKSLLNKLTNLCTTLKDQTNLLPEEAHLTCIDGLRLDFNHGFGIIRPSNTSNSLTVRFAGDSSSDLKNVQSYFVKLCQVINSDLANQVAKIWVNT